MAIQSYNVLKTLNFVQQKTFSIIHTAAKINFVW